MEAEKSAVVLIGHGGIPKDYPRARVKRLMALHGERERHGGHMGAEEEALELEQEAAV